MTLDRRTALKLGGAAAATLAFGPAVARSRPLRILILGGTGFIGPHFVSAFAGGGHRVTLFNRGKRDPNPKAGVEELIGDRNGRVEALKNRDWDVVVDNSGYTPSQVKLTADLLSGHVKLYIFVSSISVYADFSKPGITEDSPVAVLKDPKDENVTGETYGGLKALCEQYVQKVYGRHAAIIRPTYIAGPGDVTDRFTYWPWRVARGGEMLAPGKPSDPFQFIDVRDLADFMRRCVEEHITGVYNACNPPGSVTMGSVLEAARHVTGADTRITWASPQFLIDNEIIGEKAQGNYMPIWESADGDSAGAAQVSSDRAVKQGLEFRPLDVTIRDTLEWQRGRPEQEQKLRAGLAPEKEAELLAMLRQDKVHSNP